MLGRESGGPIMICAAFFVVDVNDRHRSMSARQERSRQHGVMNYLLILINLDDWKRACNASPRVWMVHHDRCGIMRRICE